VQVDEGASLLAEGPEQGEVRGEGEARKVDAQQLLVATPVGGAVEDRVRVVQHVLRPKGRLQVARSVRHKIEVPPLLAGLHEVGREIGPPPVRRVVEHVFAVRGPVLVGGVVIQEQLLGLSPWTRKGPLVSEVFGNKTESVVWVVASSRH